MRFHKIEMVGKFILQKVDNLPTFNFERDQGRLVYNLTDDKVYQGSNIEWAVVGAGDMPTGDINTDNPEAGNVIYYDGNLYYGDGSSWNILITENTVNTNLSSYTNQYSASYSWTVNHNLGSYANLIQCFNTSHNPITPDNIIQNSPDTLTITFSHLRDGYVTIINDNDFTFNPPTSQSGIFMGNSIFWNINHGFTNNFLIVDTWNDSGTLSEKQIPDNIIINDSNNINIDWDDIVVDGHLSAIAVNDGTGQYKSNQTSATQWNINHGLNSNEIIVQCWDDVGALIYPNYIEKIDNNNLVVDFNGLNVSGNICIISSDMTIIGGNTYFNSFSAASTWSVNHSLASQNLIVQVWSNNRVINEYTATINNDSIITIDFNGFSVAGDIMIIKVS